MESLTPIYLNIDVERRRIISIVNDGKALHPAGLPRLVHTTKGIFRVKCWKTEAREPYPLNATDTFRLIADVNYAHVHDTGTLDADQSGQVASIRINGLAQAPPATSALWPANASSEQERIPYSAVSEAAPGSYDFTVSKDLLYSYTAGDACEIEDPLMIYANTDQVDLPGDWPEVEADPERGRQSGELSIRYDATSRNFRNKLDADEVELFLDIDRFVSPSTVPTKLLSDRCYAKQSVIDAEGVPTATEPDVLTLTQGDARYLQKTTGDEDDMMAFDGQGRAKSAGFTRADALVDWDSNVAYAADQFVSYGGTLYKSLQPANTGHQPDTAATWWEAYAPGSNPAPSDPIEWGDVQNKPTEFPPEAHGHEIADVNGLHPELDEIDGKFIKQDMTVYPAKPEISGQELLVLRDTDGYIKNVPTSKFARPEDIPDGLQEIATPASEVNDPNLHGAPVVYQFSETDQEVPETVKFLCHFTGDEGATTFLDRSTFAHAVTNVGSPYVTRQASKFGSILALNGSSGIHFPVSNVDLADNNFHVSAFVFFDPSFTSTDVSVFHLATGPDTARVLEIRIESGELVVRLSQVGETGWGETLRYPGILSAQTWYHLGVECDGSLLHVLVNGVVVDQYLMENKTLKTPDAASKVRWGHGLDANSSAADFMTGYLDECLVVVGTTMFEIAPGDQSYTLPTSPWHVSQVYDIANSPDAGAHIHPFQNADLSYDGSDYWIEIPQNLNRECVHVAVYAAGSPKELITPDAVRPSATDPQNVIRVYLTSFVPLSGTWTASILARAGISGDELPSNAVDITELADQDSTLEIDFDDGEVQTVTVTGDVTVSTSNTEPGKAKHVALIIEAGGGDRAVAFPAAWKWQARPDNNEIVIEAGETIHIDLLAVGTIIHAAGGVEE